MNRLVLEEDNGPVLYYTINNSRVYKGREIQGMTIHQDVSICTISILHVHVSV